MNSEYDHCAAAENIIVKKWELMSRSDYIINYQRSLRINLNSVLESC